jgi:putative redox protein
MAENILKAAVALVNDKLQFEAQSGENPVIRLDYSPPLGDGDGYKSLELLLVSLAGCSASTIVSILRKKRRTITAFTVMVEGRRRETHPTVFETITLRFRLVSPDAEEADLARAIELSEETYCPVYAMLAGSVAITSEAVLERG